MQKYKYIKDLKYGGFAVQKHKTFLWWSWWASEWLVNTEDEAVRLVKYFNNWS